MRFRAQAAALAAAMLGFFLSCPARGEEIAVLVEAPPGVDFVTWRRGLGAAGAPVRHAFPPAGGLVVVEAGDLGALRLALPPGVAYHETSPEGAIRDRLLATDAGRVLWHAQRRLLGLDGNISEGPPGLPLDHDALAPPPVVVGPRLAGCTATQLKRTTSEYLLGSVSVNLILPESNGAIDTQTENWSAARETSVSSGVVQAMNDLAGYYAGRSLVASLQPAFTYHTYFGRTVSAASTSYEPIVRNADPSNDPGSGEGLWVREILSNLGYSTSLGKWDMVREFDGDTRLADGTDWAVTLFVADSANDSDGQFADGYFAYAWLSGPYAILTYDNDGWGISQMNKVARHETCHLFHALDEYTSSSCTCTEVSGYVNYANQNCHKSCLIDQNCIMNEAARQSGMCFYTAGQIGWGDADSDTIPDPVDIAPGTAMYAYAPNPTYSGHVLPTGLASIQARTSQSVWGYQCDVNILDVAGVSWRVNGGAWQAASPWDGTFDGPSEGFFFNASMAPGVHFFEAYATDSAGQVDASPAGTYIQVIGLPGVPDGATGGTPMQCTKMDPAGGSIQVVWDQSTCKPPGNHLVAGYGSSLPTSYGGVYTPNLPTTYCTLGTGGTMVLPIPFDPAVDATRFIWWVMVPDGGSGEPWIEGSWGKNSGAVERSGPGAYGASGVCLASDKDTGVACGH